MNKKAAAYVLAQLKKGRTDLEMIKRECAAAFNCQVVKSSELLKHARAAGKVPAEVLALLRKKPMRTLSGVTPIAIMIAPEGSCKHSCIYCPYTGKAPRSYTGWEPAALRARNANFSPSRQVRVRLKEYDAIGHPSEKCEGIVMGGTFLEMAPRYKSGFIKSFYETLNGKKAASLQTAKKQNEKALHRMIGLTIETRPDVCGEKQINEMLVYGATRVELGVQHPEDAIYKKINRGHKTADVVGATALLKDSAFKVLYHIMPGLPGSDRKKDVAMAKKLFSDERFRPDMLKIYPTLVIKGTELYEMMQRGEYTPYDSEEAAEVIAEMFRYIPKYARVMRIQRDIPANLISSGVKKSNLRELVQQKIREKGITPVEIRSREIGLTGSKQQRLELLRLDYKASSGKEIFLSCENEEALAGFARLRIPGSHVFRKEITDATALIRELHVYGREELLGAKGNVQHRGIGKMLLAEAEQIARQESMEKMLIISGVGAREYYYALGYRPDGPYVSKRL